MEIMATGYAPGVSRGWAGLVVHHTSLMGAQAQERVMELTH